MARKFPRIEAAAVDGRFHTIYHRQVQLEKLCKALVDSVQEIKNAIATDYRYSAIEIAVEYHMALTEVKRNYATLEPKACHDDEYLIANNKDAPETRRPVGIVYIEPTQHNLFYSTVVPLSAALAVGNCAIVLLENNLRAVPSLLRKILPAALGGDAFAVASTRATDTSLLSNAVCLFQSGTKEKPRINELTFNPEARVVAVVDRTANVQLAARELVTARFSFAGRSPYAPDCVLVNEFVKNDFLQAVKSEWVRIDSSVSSSEKTSGSDPKVREQLERLQSGDPGLRTIIQEARLAVVDCSSRQSALNNKMNVPILKVHGIRSLDDAIDLVNQSNDGKPCLASYYFGNLATGKYLSQFIDSEVSFINHVPREILVGPAAPSGHAVQVSDRYPAHLFSTTRPAFVHSTELSKDLAKMFDTGNGSTAQKLLAEAARPLKEFKRHPGGGVGFFEQGFLINAGIIVVSTLTVSVTGVMWFWKWSRPV